MSIGAQATARVVWNRAARSLPQAPGNDVTIISLMLRKTLTTLSLIGLLLSVGALLVEVSKGVIRTNGVKCWMEG